MSVRRFSPEVKLRMINEAIETGNIRAVARKNEVNESMLGKWVRAHKKTLGEQSSPAVKRQRSSDSEIQQARKDALTEVERLRKIVAEQALEISILKDIRDAYEKKGL